MKKITLILSALILSIITLSATDLSEIRIYLNPGHGGYDSGDRSIATPQHPVAWVNTDTLGFWESSSNLTKALYLDTLLRQHNAITMLSRTLNRSVDDRSLSEIGEEASTFNPDAFLSIHSNASTGAGQTGANYLYLIYRGVASDNYASIPYDPNSQTMAQACYPFILNNPLQRWSHYFPYNPSNVKVNAQNLGVLNACSAVGFLSEGSFHDYLPEACRLVNPDYRKYESLRFLYFYLDYFKADIHPVGAVVGYVKNKDAQEEVITHNGTILFNYANNCDDVWKIMNGAKVHLKDAAGNILRTYQVDNEYNGFFSFRDVLPGNYKLSVEHPGYLMKDQLIEVTAGASSAHKLFVQNASPDPSTAPDNYPQPDQDPSALAMSSYPFIASGAQSNPAFLQTPNIKRIAYRNNKFYVLADNKIQVIHAGTYALIKELDLSLGQETITHIADIAFTADNYLIACNEVTIEPNNPSSDRFKIYLWEDDDAAPVLHCEFPDNGGWETAATVGRTMAVSGPSWYLTIYTPAVKDQSKELSVALYRFKRQTPAPELTTRFMKKNYSLDTWGEDCQFMISPRGNKDQFIVTGSQTLPVEYQFDISKADGDALVEKGMFAQAKGFALSKNNGSNYFRYQDRIYMASPVTIDDKTKASVLLFDITDGLDKAKRLTDKNPHNGIGDTPAEYLYAYGSVNNYDINLTVLAANQGVASFKRDMGPAVANIYASELKSVKVTDGYEISFVLNADASEVTIELFAGEEIIASEDLGAIEKGRHTKVVTFSSSTITPGQYRWRLQVTAKEYSARPVRFNNANAPEQQFYHSRGVITDNSFESPFFGRVYVTSNYGGKVTGRTTTKGIYIMDALLTDITQQGAEGYQGGIDWLTDATNKAVSPFRSYPAPNGDLYLCDYSDPHSGVWVMNPADPTAAFREVFGGVRNSKGLRMSGATPIGGSISSLHLLGMGDSLQLFTFDEDYLDETEVTKVGNILRYDLGESIDQWESKPSAVVYNNMANSGLILNTNDVIYPDQRGGWWICQNRSANQASVPSLIHYSAQEVLTIFSDAALIPGSLNAAAAVSFDGSLIAILVAGTDVRIYQASYDQEGIPALAPYSKLTAPGGSVYSMAFDRANNVWITSNSAERLGGYAIPSATATNFTTPAPSKDLIEITSVGIEETSASDLNLYPNPATERVQISSGKVIRSIQIVDLTGRVVLSVSGIGRSDLSIDIAHLPAGSYLLKADGRTVKMIKN